MAKDEYGMTPRQRAWCDYYIECGNATEAAKRAGYKLPEQSGKDNTRKQPCKQYIAERMKPTQERRIADADEVLQYLSDVMRGAVKDQFGLDASLQDRTKAAQELMKRYAVADLRQQSTMQRLDSLFVEFRAALATAPQEPQPTPQGTGDSSTTATEGDSAQDSTQDTAPEPA